MAKITKITPEDVQEFTKFLIEAGGILAVDEKLFITAKATGDKIQLKDKGEVFLPIKIYHTNRDSGEYFVLNPFKETTAPNKASTWFFETIEMRMTWTLLTILKDIINLSTSKEESAKSKIVELLNVIDVSSLVATPEMVEQLDTLNPETVIKIFYHPRQKQGQVQSDLNDPAIMSECKKIKKKTWAFINDAFWAIFGCTPAEIHKLFSYTSTTIPAPHSEAVITLMYRYFKLLDPICKILDIESPDIEQFSSHLVHVENYQRLVTFDDNLVNRPIKEIVPPWSNKDIAVPVNTSQTSVSTIPSPSRGVPQVIMTGQGIQNIDKGLTQNNNQMVTGAPGQKFGSTGFVQSGHVGFGNRGVSYGGGGYGNYNRGYGTPIFQQQVAPPKCAGGVL